MVENSETPATISSVTFFCAPLPAFFPSSKNLKPRARKMEMLDEDFVSLLINSYHHHHHHQDLHLDLPLLSSLLFSLRRRSE